MSSVEQEPRRWWMDWRVGVGAAITLVILLVVVSGYLTTPPGTGRAIEGGAAGTSELEAAQRLLAENTSLAGCRAALQQINGLLGRSPNPASEEEDKQRQKELNDQLQQIDELRRRADLNLDEKEVEELRSANHTLLDAHYLQCCLLLRDAAHHLEVGMPNQARRGDPVEPATTAFDWVVRQVRLLGWPAMPAPPDWVLRRGRGRDLDRGLIFLSMLPQLSGPDGRPGQYVGSLVFCPDSDRKLRLWACGVVVPGKSGLYLFDPRLGLAIPGPGGQGVATLAQARQGEVLRQLDVPGGPSYDVTAEQARAAEIYVFHPLSALAPRQKKLQDLLPPAVDVRLSVSPLQGGAGARPAADLEAELDQLRQAATGTDKAPPVGVLGKGVKQLWVGARSPLIEWRNFLPAEEGGVARPAPLLPTDQPGFFGPAENRQVFPSFLPEMHFKIGLAPWYAFPMEFHAFQRHGDLSWDSKFGGVLRGRFLSPWERGTLEARSPRDRLLHGEFPEAAQLLVGEREVLQKDFDRAALTPAALGSQLDAWIDLARPIYAEAMRGKDKTLSKEAEAVVWNSEAAYPILVLLGSAQAQTRGPEVTYQLGLCKQEEAERLQARLDLLGSAAPAEETEKVQAAWGDALDKWKGYAADYPEGIDRTAVRRLRGRAEQALGLTGDARRSWQAPAGLPKELERVVAAYPDPAWKAAVEKYAEWERLALLYRSRQPARQ